MHDLETELSDHWDELIDQSQPVDIEAVIGDLPGVDEQTVHELQQPNESTRRGGRGRLIGVLVAAAATLLVVAGVVLVTDDSRDDVVTGPASSTGPTDEVSSPSEADSVDSPIVVDALGYHWSRAPHDEVVLEDKVPFTAGMTDVAVGGPGLVAVGQGDDGAAVWTSVDGVTWTRVPHDMAAFGGHVMHSVAVGGPGLVAVGGTESENGAAVWTSVDGITWSRVPWDEAVLGGQPVDIVAGGPGLVAVGSDDSGSDVDAAVWTSVDGTTWSRVPWDEAVFGGDGEQTMSSVTAGGPGLVAVGSDGFDDGVDRGQMGFWNRDFLGEAAVWTSVDGITWARVPHDEAVFGGEGNQWMNAVAAAGPGLVAVGGDWSSEARAAGVWTSVDGITWSSVPQDGAVLGGDHGQAMNSVTATGSGLVAVGRAWTAPLGDHAAGGDDSAASVWTSIDGITWSWMGYDETVFGSEDNSSFLLSDGPVFTEYRQYMTSVVATDSGVVAVGADWSGPSHGAAVWVGTIED